MPRRVVPRCGNSRHLSLQSCLAFFLRLKETVKFHKTLGVRGVCRSGSAGAFSCAEGLAELREEAALEVCGMWRWGMILTGYDVVKADRSIVVVLQKAFRRL